jgi:hypothetical protein
MLVGDFEDASPFGSPEKKGSMKEFSTSFEKIREYSLLKGLASLFAQSF